MGVTIYEFPLCEKVRNYLRLELLFQQLEEYKSATSQHQQISFFNVLFDLLEIIERLDLRSDFIRDLDQQERNLLHWSKHPEVDSDALDATLRSIHKLLGDIKQTTKFAAKLKDDKFLSNIRQRFTIAGGATGFDLPSLFCWIKQDEQYKATCIKQWFSQLSIVNETILLLLSFLREKGRFEEVIGKNGFFQGNVADKAELIRVQCDISKGQYPVLSGNTYRYGIKFMQLNPEEGNSGAVAEDITFKIARC